MFPSLRDIRFEPIRSRSYLLSSVSSLLGYLMSGDKDLDMTTTDVQILERLTPGAQIQTHKDRVDTTLLRFTSQISATSSSILLVSISHTVPR
jgi:hypothetical protein